MFVAVVRCALLFYVCRLSRSLCSLFGVLFARVGCLLFVVVRCALFVVVKMWCVLFVAVCAFLVVVCRR